MSRPARLLQLLDALRRARLPQTGPQLAQAAQAAMDRIRSALPLDLRIAVDTSGLLVPNMQPSPQTQETWQAALRRAIRAEHKVVLHYEDQHGALTQRQVWPFAMAYFERARVVSAWCELRQDFRHFRADRVHALQDLGERYPERRQTLIQRWLDQTGHAI